MTEYYLGRVPQSFPEAVKEMRGSLTIDEAEVTRSLFAVCLSDGEHKTLENGIQIAEEHFTNGEEASAWYVLLTVAERKGLIQGYSERRYEDERPEALRQQLVEGGKKGGERKGESFTALADATLKKLAEEGEQCGGWRLNMDLANHLVEVAKRVYGAGGITPTSDQIEKLKKHLAYQKLAETIKNRR